MHILQNTHTYVIKTIISEMSNQHRNHRNLNDKNSVISHCQEHGFEDQLLNSALMGRPEEMMEAARHYETKQGFQDKAVMLYHKVGTSFILV